MKRAILVLAALALVETGQSKADMISLGTGSANASNWFITGAGASDATADEISGGRISIISTGFNTGTFVSDGSPTKFQGFWTADETFFLPANAINVTLTFSNLIAGDRVVAELNGTIIGAAGLATPGEGSGEAYGPGYMTLKKGSEETFNFLSSGVSNGTDGAPSGTITSGFNLGGENTLELIINNTGTGITGTTQNFQDAGDGTAVKIDAIVTYDLAPTPEPASLTLLGIGIAGMAGYGWKRRKQAA